MKFFPFPMVLLLLLCLLVVGNALPQNLGVDHVGVVVPNVTFAMRFFMEVFNCRFDWEVKRDPTPTSGERGWDVTFGVHPDSFMPHVVMLKCGKYHLAQYIELFEWVSPDQKKPEGDWFKFSDVGNSYIAFTFGNIAKVVQDLKANVFPKWPGTRFIQDPPMSFPLRGELTTSFFIVSPWGQWIELSEWSESTPKHPHLQAVQAEDESGEDVVFGGSADAPTVERVQSRHPLVGSSVDMIETPFVHVDIEAMEKNVGILVDRLKVRNIGWLAVAKAHKSPQLAQRLVNLGAQGAVVMTVEEAEAMSSLRAPSDTPLIIFIANTVTVPSKLIRLCQLASIHPQHNYRVLVDSGVNVADLDNAAKGANAKLHVLVELNVGHNRTGTTPAFAVQLASLIKTKQNLVFGGICGYERKQGHTPVLPPPQKKEATLKAHAVLADAKQRLAENGIDCPIVSGGGSSNYPQAIEAGVITELQAGGVALCDKLYLDMANLRDHGHVPALFVESTVTSVNSDPERAVSDAGFKSVGLHPFAGNPVVVNAAQHCVYTVSVRIFCSFCEVSGLSAEHLRMKKLTEGNCSVKLKLHDRVRVIPGYGDSFLSFQKRIFAVSKGIVTDVWKVVDLRAT